MKWSVKSEPINDIMPSTDPKLVTMKRLGSGCGSVGRAVASKSRCPQFESRHRQKFKLNIFSVNCFEKTKIKKRGREGPIFINNEAICNKN